MDLEQRSSAESRERSRGRIDQFWRWSALPVGLSLMLAVPLLVAQGDRTEPLVAEFAALGLLGSAFLWGRHAFTRGSSSTGSLLSKAAAGAMVTGLVIATTLFFVAVGALSPWRVRRVTG